MAINTGRCDEIGKHARLKIVCLRAWEFDSPHRHAFKSNLSHMYRGTLAYIIEVAIGDGNLSNPNGRAVRLRISCDTKYPRLIEKMSSAIKEVCPKNKVSFVYKKAARCGDISSYSNQWPALLGWNVGAKYNQDIHIPKWIQVNKKYSIACLKGLIETDGAVYFDRKYKAIIFTSIIKNIADEVFGMIKDLNFEPKLYKIKPKNPDGNRRKIRYNVRLTKDVDKFLKLIPIEKS